MNKTIAELVNNPLKEEEDFSYDGSPQIVSGTEVIFKWFEWGGMDFRNKKIHVDKPVTGQKIYSDMMDAMDDDIDLMIYVTPIMAITNNLFELQDDWHFADDRSRHNIQMSSWQEGDDIWLGIVPLTVEPEPIEDLRVMWKQPDDEMAPATTKIPTITRADAASEFRSFVVKKESDVKDLMINMARADEFETVASIVGMQDLNGPQMIYVPIQRKERHVCWNLRFGIDAGEPFLPPIPPAL